MKKILRIIRISLTVSKPRPKVGNWFEKFITSEYITPYSNTADYIGRRIFTKGRGYKIIDGASLDDDEWQVIVKTDRGQDWVLYKTNELQRFRLIAIKKTYGKKTKDHKS